MFGGRGIGEEKLEMNGTVVEGDLTLYECLLCISSLLGVLHTLFTLSHSTPSSRLLSSSYE